MADAEIRKEAAGEKAPLLQVDHLKTHFDVTKGLFSPKQIVKAVDDVSFYVGGGETYGLVGESGCGKSTLGRTLVKIYPATGGKVLYKGQDIARLGKEEEKHFRKEVQMIFQDPYASLNPRMTVRDIIAEGLETRGNFSKAEKDERVCELLSLVGLRPEYRSRYPHEFSGGQRQRICIATSLLTPRQLLIADEPGTALDVTVQGQIHKLLRRLVEEEKRSLIMITHSLGVVRELVDRIYVMYAGNIVENCDTAELFKNPLHPYTQGLLACVPRLTGGGISAGIYGYIPSYVNPPKGGRFFNRCPHCTERCKQEKPGTYMAAENHAVSCFLYEDKGPAKERGDGHVE